MHTKKWFWELKMSYLWFCAFLWAPKPYFLTWCQDLAACKILHFIQERSNTLQPSEKLLLIIPSQVGPSAITNIGYCYHIKMMTFYFNCSFFEEIFFSCSAFLSPVFWTSYSCGYLVWFFFPPISFVTLTSNCFGKLCMLTKIFKILNFQLELKEGNIKHGFKTEGEWLSLGTTSKLLSQNVPH